MADYLRPSSLDDALAALADRPWTMLAGGTDVYPANVGHPITGDILDVTGLATLRDISIDDGRVRIPALATWTDIVRADLPPAFDGLKTAARSIGGVQIQNRGTLAGNLCNASPAADGLPNLIALGARVELSSTAGRREVDVGEFVVGNRRTIRRPDELVTAILVPVPSPTARSTFLKLGSRAYLVISIASVAAVLDVGSDGRVTSARIVVGACSEVPRRIVAAEERLVGVVASSTLGGSIEAADLDLLSPIDDVRGTGAYRRDVATTLVRRAVSELSR
ncbi:MAG TPA: xanthine dehydrogenase family protein subunit M [Candidatus Limnocylindrales bacterium]|nr:xanthine dehydrogenase family protein subunit M [Candidatus Limnocylindrales bacterium]